MHVAWEQKLAAVRTYLGEAEVVDPRALWPVPDAAEQAAEALRSAGPNPSSADLNRFIGRVGRVLEIADEIQTILGR